MDEPQKRRKQSSRGKETLFRVTYAHQSKLIQIADYKANIIISVSTMIISAVVAITGYGAVSDKMGAYGMKLVIPVILIVLTCLISLVLAIQVARPKIIQSWKSTGSTQKPSLLFFGVIASYSQQAYLEKMKILLNSSEDIYESMTIDLYNQGVILKRKYNLLVYAYQVLMYGFVIAVSIFLGFFALGF